MQKEVPPFFNPHLDDEADVKYFDIVNKNNLFPQRISSASQSTLILAPTQPPATKFTRVCYLINYPEGFSFNQMSPASNHSLTGDIPGDIPRDKDSNFMMNIEETSDNNPN
jgi:hypothetical protein